MGGNGCKMATGALFIGRARVEWSSSLVTFNSIGARVANNTEQHSSH